MTDVLFVIPPGLGPLAVHVEGTAGMGGLLPRSAAYPYPPHTVAACAAAARRAGHGVSILDASQESGPAAVAQRVADTTADVVAIQVSEGTRWVDGNFLAAYRHVAADRGTPRLLFGPSAHFVADSYLQDELVDAVLTGEPDAAIADAASAVAARDLRGRIAAADLCPAAYQPDGLLADLDSLPFPAWDIVPWQPYRMVSLSSSRGCPAGCTFCAYTVSQGRRFRSQSVERTLAEWEWLARQIKAPYLMLRDPVFGHDRARAVALCEGIAARGLSLRWMCESRPEHFDRDLLKLMAAAGCATVKIGVESGDPALLATLGRLADGQTADDYLAQVGRVAADCDAAHIRCRVFVMAGLPGQTSTSLGLTEAALRRLPGSALVHAKPYQSHPGTPLSGPTAVIAPSVLDRLQAAARPAPQPLQRVWRAAVRRLAPLFGPSAQNRAQAEPGEVVPSAPAGRGDGAAGAARLPAEPRTSEAGGEALPVGDPLLALRGERVFLTGGNGFLGGHVARALTDAGATVHALVRPDSPLGQLADLPVRIVEGDLTRPTGWPARLDGCRFCFHVAALYAGAEQAAQMYAVNAGGTSALFSACAAAAVARVVYTGTIGTVGRRPAGDIRPPDESVPFVLWDQASHYVRSKFLGELIAQSWHGALDVVIVKPTAPVGTWDARPSATGRRILATLAEQVTSYPPGGINHIPVVDAAAGHLLAAVRGRPGETYILGHQQGNLGHEAFLRTVALAAGTPPLRPVAPPAGRQPVLLEGLTADPAKAVAELGLPQSDLAAAFRDAVMWYRTEAARRYRRQKGGERFDAWLHFESGG